MEKMFFIRRRRISVIALVLCCTVTIFIVRTLHEEKRNGQQLTQDLEQMNEREEKDNFPDEQDFVESEQIEREDKTYWVDAAHEGSQVYNGNTNDRDENHGGKYNNLIDLKDNNEENTKHINEQSENRNSDDFWEKENETEVFDFDKDVNVDVMENDINQERKGFEVENIHASQSNGRQQNRGAANKTFTKRTSRKTNWKLDKTRGSEVDTISRASNQMFASDDHKRTSTTESMETKKIFNFSHVTESDDQTPLSTELKNVTKMPTSDYAIQSDGSISTSTTKSTDITKNSASNHVTETSNPITKNATEISTFNRVTELDDPTPKSTTEATNTTEAAASGKMPETNNPILSISTVSKNATEIPTSDHVTELVDPTPKSTTEATNTTETGASGNVTETEKLILNTLTVSKNVTEIPTSDHVTELVNPTPKSTTEATNTTETGASGNVTETDKLILNTLTVSKNVTEIPTSDHVTELVNPTPKSTTEATNTTETGASGNVTETDKLILNTTAVSKNVTRMSMTDYVTKLEGKTPILATESKNKLETLASDHVTESDNKSTVLSKLNNRTETKVSSMTWETTSTSKSLITLIFTEANNNTDDDDDDKVNDSDDDDKVNDSDDDDDKVNDSDDDDDDKVNDSNDDDDKDDNDDVKTSVSTPRPHYTIEAAVSRDSSSTHGVCNFPRLDPFDKSILHLLKEVGTNPGCRDRYPEPLFDVINNRLVPKKENNVSNEIDFKSIRVETIHRNENDDDNFHIKEQGNPFVRGNDSVFGSYINESDFFRLKYTMKNGNVVEHYFSRVVPKENVILQSENAKKDLTSKKNKAKGLPLNVLIIGIDSTAANNFYRKLHYTLGFLKSKLNSYFFKGYSVIGDATTPALCALLTGKKEHELPKGRRGFYGAETVDEWPWLSKKYKAHGYVTLCSEDDPRMSAFNLRLLGFGKPPYDHYSRPFWLALEDAGERDEPGLCSKSISMVNYTIEYLKSYFEAYPDTPKFAFAFAGYLAHAHPNHLSYADYDLLHLLKFLVKNKHDDNTVLILLGDHGSRNDDVRNTMQGKLEERLPWLSITLPKWVEKQYPEIGKAMKWNQDKLCTPFDVHYTLRHVLTYPIRPSGERGMSLFEKVPANRTCEDAEIDEHWCPCLKFNVANTSDPKITQAAKEIVKSINNKTSINRLLQKSCVRLSLKSVLSAVKFEPNEKVQTFSSTNQDDDRGVNFGERTSDNKHFQITIETSPGDGRFEATVTVEDNDNIIVNPNISRTNTYGSQPKCILRKYPYVRKFCLCKI